MVIKRRKTMRPDTIFATIFTAGSVIASVGTAIATEFWVGLLVYAICCLELIVILIVSGVIGWWY